MYVRSRMFIITDQIVGIPNGHISTPVRDDVRAATGSFLFGSGLRPRWDMGFTVPVQWHRNAQVSPATRDETWRGDNRTGRAEARHTHEQTVRSQPNIPGPRRCLNTTKSEHEYPRVQIPAGLHKQQESRHKTECTDTDKSPVFTDPCVPPSAHFFQVKNLFLHFPLDSSEATSGSRSHFRSSREPPPGGALPEHEMDSTQSRLSHSRLQMERLEYWLRQSVKPAEETALSLHKNSSMELAVI